MNVEVGAEAALFLEKEYITVLPLQCSQGRTKISYRHDKPNEPTKEGHLSLVLFESPFNLSFNSQQGPPHSSLSG